MNLFIITGTSRGIGFAIANQALQQADAKVLGIARTNSISNPRFSFQKVDLANADEVNAVVFPPDEGFSKITLINNAGMLGDVNRLGALAPQSIANTIAVNLTAPTILMNRFLSAYAQSKGQKVIVNISSGAGRKAISSWSVYCTTKAAIDMLSEAAQQEQIEQGTSTKIFSVAPGVVDTAMQAGIRSVEKANFSQLDRFVELKQKGLLASPESIAEKLLLLVEHPQKFSEVIFDVRKF